MFAVGEEISSVSVVSFNALAKPKLTRAEKRQTETKAYKK